MRHKNRSHGLEEDCLDIYFALVKLCELVGVAPPGQWKARLHLESDEK